MACRRVRVKTLPFGFSCSVAIFAMKLAKVLASMFKENWVNSYLADIIAYAPTYSTILHRLEFSGSQTMGRDPKVGRQRNFDGSHEHRVELMYSVFLLPLLNF